MARKRFLTAPALTFHGAARTVTGSMHRLDTGSLSVLLDCGFVQGPRAESYHRNATFPFRPKDIDVVVLSHAHIDHCGNLPNLIKQGFSGPIYCTPATRALTAVMLGDAAKIQAIRIPAGLHRDIAFRLSHGVLGTSNPEKLKVVVGHFKETAS